MRHVAKCVLEDLQPLANRRGGIHVERRARALGELGQGNALAVQNELRIALRRAPSALAENKPGRPLRARKHAAPLHFFLELPGAAPSFTLMATTVSSSKASTPAACSATALNNESTTQSADMSPQSAMILFHAPASKQLALAVARVQNAVTEEHEHVAGLHAEAEFVILGFVKQAQRQAGGFDHFNLAGVHMNRPRQAGIGHSQRAVRSSHTA